jgi:hypothetical protein
MRVQQLPCSGEQLSTRSNNSGDACDICSMLRSHVVGADRTAFLAARRDPQYLDGAARIGISVNRRPHVELKGGGWTRVRMQFPFARDARSETMERPKGARLKGWIESPNALRWRFGQLLGCAFTETESSKIKIGNLPAAPTRMLKGRPQV